MSAEIVKISPLNYYKDVLSKAAKVLAEGGLVVFPTETVYGMGVNADNPAAVKKLYAVKKSPENKPFTYHLASADDIYRFVPKVPRLAIRLMKAFWPGPMTLVLPDGIGRQFCFSAKGGPSGSILPRREHVTSGDSQSKGNWIGLRVPDHPIAHDLIQLAKVPIIASSANITGQEPPTDAQEVIRTLGDKIDMIIDAGATQIGVSSSVIRIAENGKYEILREGFVSEDKVKRFAYKMIVFICSGNTCRSPMAMGLYRKMLADKFKIPAAELEKNGYKIVSAGTSAIYDSPASEMAIEVTKEIGVDITSHRSQPVTFSMIDEADEVYVMTQGHLTTLKEWVPGAMDRIKLLDPNGESIDDPIGAGRDSYLRALTKIRNGLDCIIKN